jgi:hypothetical protein
MTVETIDARGYSLRHVHPTATYESEGGTATVLGKTYGFTWLPTSHMPTDSGFVEGTYTRRLGDSGEFSITFPNGTSSLGPWRDRFSGDGALEFIEVYRDDRLEFVGCIQRVEIDRGSVTISGPDAWALLRRAYERDRTWTAAPQEVATYYTRVPVAAIAEDFPGSSLPSGWVQEDATATVADGFLTLSVGSGSPESAAAYVDLDPLGDAWRITAAIPGGYPSIGTFEVSLYESGSGDDTATVQFSSDSVTLTTDTTTVRIVERSYLGRVPITLQIERRGRWVVGFVNGTFIGFIPAQFDPDRLRFKITNAGVAVALDIESVTVVRLDDFLARGSDLGDYVLPGDQPTGGLRGRYFDGADMAGFSSAIRNSLILAPDREAGAWKYAERLDASMSTSASLSIPVQPGNSGEYYAIRWFGSVYLRGDLGNYTIETTSVDDGVRVWIGKTAWGEQLIDDWNPSSGTNTATWTASDYGSQAGWYPIVVEYFQDTSGDVFRLQFTPPASTYTDPGGTSITASTKITIPSTSLSPLGCFDNRVQGTSHFDLVSQAAQSFGYDITLEPMSLESGEFPGRVVPRLRVGSDTDVILSPDDTDGVEPALSPGVTLDATDQARFLIGSGAGIADGSGSQTTAEVFDLANADAGLFALEAWVDAGDIAFTDLLAARLNAELALRGTEWEEVRATPRAQERMADTWPLSDTLSAMYWQPGDGVRLIVPDIAVEDTEPRQMIQVTRTFMAEGRTGTQVAFRQRPRSGVRTTRGFLRSALALGRSYQREKATLTGGNVAYASVGAGAYGGFVEVALHPGDKVIKATIRIAVNDANQPVGLEVNGVDRTSALGGAWSTIPAEIDITGYATQVSSTDNRLYARAQNTGGSTSIIQIFLNVEVLR